MVTASIAFFLALVLALVLTPLVRQLALRLGAVDVAGISNRKVHGRSTPRLGGLALVGAFYAPLLGLLVVDSEVGHIFSQDMSKVLGLLLGGVAIAILGCYDDLVGANAPKKFTVQIAVALALYALGFRISAVSTPFAFTIELGWMALPVSVLWIVGVINAFNLIDGLDGLASGVAFFAAAATLLLAIEQQNVLMMLFMATLVGAILGFLVFNFNPASIFMGDTGSMFLGFIMATTSVQTASKGPATVAMIAPVLALGLPIMDTLLAMWRRFWRGRPMFEADREHVHHRLLAKGHSHRATVLLLYLVSLFLAVAAVAVAVARGTWAALALLIAVAGLAAFLRKLGYLHVSSVVTDTTMAMQERRHNQALRAEVRRALVLLDRSASLEEAWQATLPLASHMGLARSSLEIRDHESKVLPARAGQYRWEARPGGQGPALVATYDLWPAQQRACLWELTWNDGRQHVLPQDESALGSIADELARAIRRMAGENRGALLTPLRAKRLS